MQFHHNNFCQKEKTIINVIIIQYNIHDRQITFAKINFWNLTVSSSYISCSESLFTCRSLESYWQIFETFSFKNSSCLLLLSGAFMKIQPLVSITFLVLGLGLGMCLLHDSLHNLTKCLILLAFA